MDMHAFMAGYQRAWETADEHRLASLFAEDGVYHNTPFDQQRGHDAIKQYWQRTKLQADIQLHYEVIHADPGRGVAHWRTTYQVTSEELFALWAKASGTSLLARKPGEPLPRLVLDGVAVAEFNEAGLCQTFRIGWHSKIADETSH